MGGVLWLNSPGFHSCRTVFLPPPANEVLLTALVLPAAAFKISNAKIAGWIAFQTRWVSCTAKHCYSIHAFHHNFRNFLFLSVPQLGTSMLRAVSNIKTTQMHLCLSTVCLCCTEIKI